MMKYDNKKTLTENKGVVLLEQDSKEFEQGKTDVYPISGYTAYNTPKIGNTKGGVSYMYFPEDATIETWEMALPENFPKVMIDEKKQGKKLWRPILTVEHLNTILPPGTVRRFTTKDGEQFTTSLRATEKNNGLFVFDGYISYKTKQHYKSPNPEDFKSLIEQAVDKVGAWGQVIASIVVSALVAYATGGMSLGYQLLWEVLAEAAINIPFSYAEYQKGNNWRGHLGLVFSLLPFMDARLLGLVKLNKSTAKNIAEKLWLSTADESMTITKFYRKLNEEEKYLFSRIIQQDTRVVGKELEKVLNNFLKNPKLTKPAWKKIMLKDKNWWKNMGLQFSTAVGLMLIVNSNTETFNESEIKRLSGLVEKAMVNVKKNGHNLSEELLDSAIKEMTSKQFDELYGMSDDEVAKALEKMFISIATQNKVDDNKSEDELRNIKNPELDNFKGFSYDEENTKINDTIK